MLTLVHLADHDGAGLLELADRPDRLLGGLVEVVKLLVDLHPHRVDVPGHLEVSLDAERHAVKQPEGLASDPPLSGAPGGVEAAVQYVRNNSVAEREGGGEGVGK